MSEHLRLDRIKDLRRSLKAPQRTSLLDFIDDTLEILEEQELRLHRLEKDHEEND